MLGRLGLAALAAAALLVALAQGPAADLRIAVAAEATALDPHYYNLNPNMEVDDHLYDYLLSFDAQGGLIPGLAGPSE